MANADLLTKFNKTYDETGTQTISAPSGTYTHRTSIPANQNHGILTFSEIGTGFVLRLGGIYFFTTDSDDAVARSTKFVAGTVSAGSGTSAGTYTFYYSRPEVFNRLDDSQVGTTSYGTLRTPVIVVDQLYIDTATDELVTVFATTASFGNYSFNVGMNITTYQVIDA